MLCVHKQSRCLPFSFVHFSLSPSLHIFTPQAQQGVQKKKFKHLDDMVEYYRHSRRGLVCALTLPISQSKEGEGEDKEEEEEPDSGDCHMTNCRVQSCDQSVEFEFTAVFALLFYDDGNSL